MSFYNDCCRKALAEYFSDPHTGDTYQCLCRNEFMYDGQRWTNMLELGQRKIDKYRQIHRVNQLVRTSETPAPPSPTTEF